MKIDTSYRTPFDVQRSMVEQYLVSLCQVRAVDTNLAARVVDALDRLDATAFDEIQRATLERFPTSTRSNSYLDLGLHLKKAMRMYLDFIEINRKNRKFISESKRNRKILDIGSGSGSFCFVCNALGHHAVGLDKPQSEQDAVLSLSHLLTTWHQVDVIEHALAAGVPLPIEDRAFDDVVIFNPTFYGEWREQDWDLLFSELIRCARKDNSSLYMKINTPKMQTAGGERYSYEQFACAVAKHNHRLMRERLYIVDLR